MRLARILGHHRDRSREPQKHLDDSDRNGWLTRGRYAVAAVSIRLSARPPRASTQGILMKQHKLRKAG